MPIAIIYQLLELLAAAEAMQIS